jgi:hypothetical protein
MPARLRLGGLQPQHMEETKATLIEIWMSNVTERAKRHGLTRDALYKSLYRNVPILTAITADVQEMQKLLADLGIELRSPAEIHMEIRVAIEDVYYYMEYWRKLIKLEGKLDAMTTNVVLHRMSNFILIARQNNMEIDGWADIDDGPFIHLSAKEKHTVFL